MSVTCFVFCGAACALSTDHEEAWGAAAVRNGIADKFVVLTAPDDALGGDWANWWVRYEPLPGERFNSTLNAPTHVQDMERTLGCLRAQRHRT